MRSSVDSLTKAAILLLLPLASYGQAIELLCEGVVATHHNGFGSTELNWSEKSPRLVQ
jgi:hypothetical protein